MNKEDTDSSLLVCKRDGIHSKLRSLRVTLTILAQKADETITFFSQHFKYAVNIIRKGIENREEVMNEFSEYKRLLTTMSDRMSRKKRVDTARLTD
jgi:hypothetical protein